MSGLAFGLLSFALSALAVNARATEENDAEFQPPAPVSEYLPAAPGEPPIDFCSEWNPEFGYRGYRCCSNTVTRTMASVGKRGRRKMNACAPDRNKWQFCDEETPAQKEYIAAVKNGKIDPLEHIRNSVGSKGGQSFCGPSNGFLVEGRPLVPTASNRIELRNEARCSNFGTDPMIGAIEWMGREIKREFHEPEFERARLIVGDISAPRGGCVSGRGGRRAHKSHTGGEDIDFAYFNPRASYAPEEHFTKTFYVASNWWMLKKLFKNPFACVKVVFVDKVHINALSRYAQTDPNWSKLHKFIRHVRGHRDHFHVRIGSGPGVPGCASDPALEEDEDTGDEGDGELTKSAPAALAANAEEASDETDAATDSPTPDEFAATEEAAAQNAAEVDPPIKKRGIASMVTSVISPTASIAASGDVAAPTTLPPYKLEPAITEKYAEKRPRRVARRAKRKKHH